MPEEFGSIVNLKNNQVSKTIKTPYGYHIFKVVDVKAARQMSFSESKNTIYERFSRDKQSENFEKWLLNLKNNSNFKKVLSSVDSNDKINIQLSSESNIVPMTEALDNIIESEDF